MFLTRQMVSFTFHLSFCCGLNVGRQMGWSRLDGHGCQSDGSDGMGTTIGHGQMVQMVQTVQISQMVHVYLDIGTSTAIGGCGGSGGSSGPSGSCVSRHWYLNIDLGLRGIRWVRWFKWCMCISTSGPQHRPGVCGGAGCSGGSCV